MALLVCRLQQVLFAEASPGVCSAVYSRVYSGVRRVPDCGGSATVESFDAKLRSGESEIQALQRMNSRMTGRLE